MKKLLLCLGPLLISSLAHAEPGLKVDIEGCNDIGADDLGRILAAEFKRSNDGKSTISITCEGPFVRVRVLEAGTIRQHARMVDLSTVETIARPRMLALLIGELLKAQDDLPALASPQKRIRPPALAVGPSLLDEQPPDFDEQETTPFKPVVLVDAGLALARRSFEYGLPEGVSNPPMVRAYDGATVPMARLQLQVYPFTESAPNLGVSGTYAQATDSVSRTADDQSVNAHWDEWGLNIRYQRAVNLARVGAEVGIGNQRFGFSEAGAQSWPLLQEVPDVDYEYTRFALDALFPLTPRLDASLELGYRAVEQVGTLLYQFSGAHVAAWSMGVGMDYRLSKAFRVRLNYAKESYEHDMIMEDEGIEMAASASDRFRSLTVGIRYQR